MEVDKVKFSRVLHYAVAEFISTVYSYFPSENHEILHKKRIYSEIVKRKNSIIQELRNISMSCLSKTYLEELNIQDMNKLPEQMQDLFTEKVKKIVHDVFSQDLLEIALNGNETFNITDGELYNLLYFGAMKDITSFSPSFEDGGPFHTPCFTLFSTTGYFDDMVSQKSFASHCQLSSQFQNTKAQFDEDLLEMRRISEKGFAVADLNQYNVATILRDQKSEITTNMYVEQPIKPLKLHESREEFLYNQEFIDLAVSDSSLSDSKYARITDVSEESTYFCWEDCLGRSFLHDHTYISEVTPEAAVLGISEKEYHAYSSLLNPFDAVSEDDMVHDILDVLVGIPSNTFFYDIHARKFRLKSGIHLPNLSTECTAKIVAKFVESGSMYYALQKFSKDILHACEGSVFRGMQHGIQQILCVFYEYIAAVKVNSPTMVFLKSDVMKNAELLQNFGVICGIDPEKMIINEIPKGLGLLSYLHDVARSHKGKENSIMIAVLLKYTYAPYFRFLNEWMTEGVCNDPYNEFQIIEDLNYLERRDSLFWKFAYTENVDDFTRVVPPELRDFSQDILDCGKSVKLLKYLSPELFSRKFLSRPPPPLSMVFSFPSAIRKAKECMNYLVFKKNIDCIPDFEFSDEVIDKMVIENQKLVEEEKMWELIKRRSDILFTSDSTQSNILDSKVVFQNCLEPSSFHEDYSHEHLRKCIVFPISEVENKGGVFSDVGLLFTSFASKPMQSDVLKILTTAPSYQNKKDVGFSGKLYDKIGLLFSSCGYVENNVNSDCRLRDAGFSVFTPDFSKQLTLSSYTHYPLSVVDNAANKLLLPSVETSYLHECLDSGKLHNLSKDENLIQLLFSLSTYPDVSTVEKNKHLVKNCSKKKNSFMDKLASLLVSEYSDSIDDINSCIQITSLQQLMIHNFKSVLATRVHVVEKAIMKCIVKDYHLDLLLSSLKNIYFLQDESFSQSLCEPLFNLVMKCRTPGEFAHWRVLNNILMNAISDSDYVFSSSVFTLSSNTKFLPLDMPIERTDFLQLFIMEFDVKWPLNIIVHQACIQQYLRIFSVLLEIEFLCWLLGRTWRHLVLTSKNLHLDDTPQFRTIILNRFEMDQFVRIIRNSIHQHLQGPLWKFLEKSLNADQSSIDDLESIHMQYLEKVLARCFLTDETGVLHDQLSTMLRQVYKICSAILECEWTKSEATGSYETFSFRGLVQAHEIFKSYQKVFVKRIMRESLTKKCGRYWDRDYQNFLETIMETERSIS